MNRQISMKPSGPWEVRRRIKLQSMGHAADALAVERALTELPGVVKVAADVAKHRVVVRYNASQQNFQNIVETMEKTGFPPLNNWWSRFKRNWYRSSDEITRENANAPPPKCCNKPPK
ncbi:MAG: heavy-metal-associated domain-containing protein [Candidatus Thiodiazotropha sp.]